jgi:hypothetical protein
MTTFITTPLGRRLSLFATALAGAAWLAGCTVIPDSKRHSAEEIARYQPSDFQADITTTQGEQQAREESTQRIRDALALPVGTDPNGIIPGALWNVGFLNIERDAARPMLLAALPTLIEKDAVYQRGILSGAYTLYAQESAPLIAPLLSQIKTPREFAIAAYTMLEADASPTQRGFIRSTMQSVFNSSGANGEPIWATEPRLRQLNWVLTNDRRETIKRRPPLVDLLTHSFKAGKPVVFSFQRQDRRRFGLAVVRGADGKFVRNPDGSIFNVAHLANAITNLPGTITNGNTPQGLFTITYAGTATNKWIGPTPYLYSKVPGEATLAEYHHVAEDQMPNTWNDGAYQAFLPESWRGYWPFMEAFLAGQAGRDEMLIHGTTINSDYYKGASYYPGTPSAGCLVAMEYWSSADGRLLRSDQLALVKAFARDGLTQGYLVVVELDDKLEAVAFAEIERDLLAAEARSP